MSDFFDNIPNIGGSGDYLASHFENTAALERTAPVERQDARHAEERIDQLVLACAAMWDLLREKTNLTENDLIVRMAQMDARDGNADGKLPQGARPCPKCNRPVAPKHRRCLYCSAEAPPDSVFQTL